MLLAEERLDLLVERLRALSGADRAAILRQLSFGERRRVEALLRGGDGDDAASWTGHSEALVARIAAAGEDERLTAAGRTALLKAIERRRQPAAPRSPRSLFEAVAGLFGRAA